MREEIQIVINLVVWPMVALLAVWFTRPLVLPVLELASKHLN